MKKGKAGIELSAGDLSAHIACIHLTHLELASINGTIDAPDYRDPMLAILQERGLEFEQNYLRSLKNKGLQVAEPASDDMETSIQRTISAMHAGIDVIYQASLKSGSWRGRADFLLKVNKPSVLGDWSYEVQDSKLARETRTGTILQLCLYSRMVSEIQGTMPEFMHVITPENEFTRHPYRLDDFLAYYRFIEKRLEETLAKYNGTINTYPTPCTHCQICNWWQYCENRRRDDDHLSLVAGLSNAHSAEIKKWQIQTLEKFANIAVPLIHKPSRGAVETFERLREQARVQLEARISKSPVYECLDVIEDRGFYKLPPPSDGDIFFDFESDPFAGTSGLEYLFGWILNNDPGNYQCLWALTQEEEKKAFESFVDMVTARCKEYPDLHIYHYTPFEPAALKRLMGRHATRENEIDQMLRACIFIDLHNVTRQAIRAGIESYSLKELEKFHGFEREFALRDAALQLRALERFIERRNIKDIPAETITAVEIYNREDCLSTKSLREWLETIRSRLIEQGHVIQRPELSTGEPSEKVSDQQQIIKDLYERLVAGIPTEPQNRNPVQHANWLLANMLDWYRREKKTSWWEYFRLRDMADEELIEEKAAISGLVYTGQRRQVKKSFIDTYTFPPQECDIREGDEVRTNDRLFGSIVSINTLLRTVEIKKGPSIAELHPASVFAHKDITDDAKIKAILRIGTWVAAKGIDADGEYRASRDLLLNLSPRTKAGFKNEELPQEKAVAWVMALDNGVLPIQGPPGSGKSHTAAEMILALVESGKTVGITALGHKVIVGLMLKVIKAGKKKGLNVRCLRKVPALSQSPDPDIIEETKYDKIISALHQGEIKVFGGTSWLWAREDMANSVDVLFVDEAGQLSLIDTVAVSQAASNLVLLGDPQQLKQPQQGSHPEGTEVSALEHILNNQKTIPSECGVFLDVTWRLHPKICSFISELFYGSRLISKPDLVNQQLDGNTRFSGAGLWFEAVIHDGNQTGSPEEVNTVSDIVSELLNGDVFYTDNDMKRRTLIAEDIKVIAPYNMQVNMLHAKLPSGIQVGTVDKFQGQEAPVVIFSMATSTSADAPKGMEFLYSLNRFNVAVSRAKSTFILVASPKLFEPECKSVDHMKLANAFCRYLEMINDLPTNYREA